MFVQEEMVRLQQSIEELRAASGQDSEEEKVGRATRSGHVTALSADWLCLCLQERKQLIDKQYNSDREKLQRIRLLMVTERRDYSQSRRR